jgi:hypothetical protein
MGLRKQGSNCMDASGRGRRGGWRVPVAPFFFCTSIYLYNQSILRPISTSYEILNLRLKY